MCLLQYAHKSFLDVVAALAEKHNLPMHRTHDALAQGNPEAMLSAAMDDAAGRSSSVCSCVCCKHRCSAHAAFICALYYPEAVVFKVTNHSHTICFHSHTGCFQ